jgi:uncharacterized membrane protein HdeD (DUF308 family)
MTTQAQRLFLVGSAEHAAWSSARRDRWFVALAIAALVAGLAALARPVERRAAGADEHVPSILVD